MDDNATLLWSTTSESNNLGWKVYRSISQNLGQAQQINNSLIPGAGNSTIPTDYSFIDEGLYEYIEQFQLGIDASVWYWIESISSNGESETHGPVMLELPQDEFDPGTPDLPDRLGLQQNYPNPFNPSTTIYFNVREGETANLSIYNTKGQIIEKSSFTEGTYNYVWEAEGMDSGLYFYKLESPSYSNTKKMVILK